MLRKGLIAEDIIPGISDRWGPPGPTTPVTNSRLLPAGKFYEQLRTRPEFFPLQRLCFILDIDLAKDRLATLKSIFKFLQVDPLLSFPVPLT